MIRLFCLDLAYFTTRVPDTRDTSAISAIQLQHECNTSHMSATRVKNFDFDNKTSENMFHTPIRLQGQEQFHSKNNLLNMYYSHVKMRLKSAPQKLNLVIGKAISKSYALDCSCKYPSTFPYSYG